MVIVTGPEPSVGALRTSTSADEIELRAVFRARSRSAAEMHPGRLVRRRYSTLTPVELQPLIAGQLVEPSASTRYVDAALLVGAEQPRSAQCSNPSGSRIVDSSAAGASAACRCHVATHVAAARIASTIMTTVLRTRILARAAAAADGRLYAMPGRRARRSRAAHTLDYGLRIRLAATMDPRDIAH